MEQIGKKERTFLFDSFFFFVLAKITPILLNRLYNASVSKSAVVLQ